MSLSEPDETQIMESCCKGEQKLLRNTRRTYVKIGGTKIKFFCTEKHWRGLQYHQQGPLLLPQWLKYSSHFTGGQPSRVWTQQIMPVLTSSDLQRVGGSMKFKLLQVQREDTPYPRSITWPSDIAKILSFRIKMGKNYPLSLIEMIQSILHSHKKYHPRLGQKPCWMEIQLKNPGMPGLWKTGWRETREMTPSFKNWHKEGSYIFFLCGPRGLSRALQVQVREVTFSQLKETFLIELPNSEAVSKITSSQLLEVLKERLDGNLVGCRGGFYLEWQEEYRTALTAQNWR